MDKTKTFRDKKNIEDILALTPMQEGMLSHYLKDPGTDLYFEQIILALNGPIDTGRFEKAWQAVVENNEMLRATFRWDKMEKPVQIIRKHHHPDLRYYDLTREETGPKFLEEITTADRREPFNLREVPFRVTLCKTAENMHHMIVANHHILYDGWSTGVILKEFFSAYNTPAPHRIIKSSFKEFVKWGQSRGSREEQEVFWKSYLLTGAEIVETADAAETRMRKSPAYRVRHNHRTGQYRFQFPSAVTRELSSFVKQERVTLASFLTGAWGLLLQKYNRRNDIVFDTTVSGRNARIKGIEDMVGMFINTLPFRVRTRPDDNGADLAARFYAESTERETFESTPHADINEYIDVFKKGMEPLFDSVLVLENYPLDRQLMQEKGALSVEAFSISGRTQYDLTVIITLFDKIELDIAYNEDLFDEDLLSQLCRHFVSLVDAVVNDPGKRVVEVAIMSASELEALHERFMASREAGPRDGTDYAAPRDRLEERIVDLWSELLKVDKEKIGIDHDFFDFGGHSLKAGLLVSRIHRDFSVKVPLEEIFKRSTVRQLSAYIRTAGGEEEYEPIAPAVEQDYYELSSVQQRIYALQQLDPAAAAYNVTSVMELEGAVTPAVIATFEKAFKQLIERHESLRISFQMINGEPKQKIHSPEEIAFELEYADFTRDDRGITVDRTREIEGFVRPFDLSQAPLLRARIIRTGRATFLFILDMHHIITDGFSMNIFIREFIAFCRGETSAPLKNQYKDFSQWQYSCLQFGRFASMEEYWLKEFSGEIPVLDIMTDFPRPSVQRFEGDRVYFALDKEITARLHRLARENGATLFMVLLTAFYILLHRYTGQEDIIIGTTVSGRKHPDLEAILGLFIETLAIRTYPTGDRTFQAFLDQVRAKTLAAYENDSYPFRELIRKTVDSGEMTRNPLFDVMLIVQNVDIAGLEVEGLNFKPYPYHKKMSRLDLTLEAVEEKNEIRFHIEYSTVLFKRDTVERLAGHYMNILKAAAADPRVLISGIDILSPEENRMILEDFRVCGWEPEPGTYHKDKRIEEIFEEQAGNTPDRVAVVYEDHHMTYRQLDERANILSNKLEEL